MIRLLGGIAYLAVIVTHETTDMPILALTISTRSKHLEEECYLNYKNSIQYQIKDTLSHKAYWQPIKEAIIAHIPLQKMHTEIYFSPDGIYSQINLNTLFDHKKEQYLIDETEIHMLTNTKEILTSAISPSDMSRTAVLMGDPTFSSSDTLSNPNFTQLEGTAREVSQVETLLSADG